MARPHHALVDLVSGHAPVAAYGDPDHLIASAIEHRMTGLLWSAIEEGRIELPRSAQLELARIDLRIRAHHERLWRTLEHILQRLGDVGIAVATAKGVGAEARWYRRVGERPCADIDLLLDPAELHRASTAVAALQPGHALLPHVDELAGRGWLQSIDLLFDGVQVDFHFDILKLGVTTRRDDVVWSRTEQVPAPWGDTVRALDAEMSLIVLLVHVLKDRFASLLNLAEVRRLAEDPGLDWSLIEGFIEEEGLSAVTLGSLEAVYETLALPAPPHPPPQGWRAAAIRRIWPESIRLMGQVGLVEHHRRQVLVPFLMPGREWEAVEVLARLTFPPRALLEHYYRDTSGPYPWRLVAGRVKRARERKIFIEGLRDPGSQRTGRRRPAGAPASSTMVRYKVFPPGIGHLKIPVSSRAAARAAIAMYSASRSRTLLAQRLALLAVGVAGPRILPGRVTSWRPPETWPELTERLTDELGSYDTAIIHERAQPERSGVALLLLRDDRPFAFVKIQPEGSSGLRREHDALVAMHGYRPRRFGVPDVLSAGEAGGWSYLALQPFSVALHHPSPAPPLRGICAEIAAGLEPVLTRDSSTPGHWVPMHGDLTPWNLREFPGGRLVLVDWEEAAWGPPGADEVLYRAAESALTRRTVAVEGYPEAVQFWRDRVATRTGAGREQRLRSALLAYLSGP